MHAWGRVSDCCYNIGIGNKTKRFNKQFVRSTKVYTKSFPAHTWGRVSDCCYIGKWRQTCDVSLAWRHYGDRPCSAQWYACGGRISYARSRRDVSRISYARSRGDVSTALAYHRGKSSRIKVRPTPMSYSRVIRTHHCAQWYACGGRISYARSRGDVSRISYASLIRESHTRGHAGMCLASHTRGHTGMCHWGSLGIPLTAPSDTRAAVASHTRGHAGMWLASHTRGHSVIHVYRPCVS